MRVAEDTTSCAYDVRMKSTMCNKRYRRATIAKDKAESSVFNLEQDRNALRRLLRSVHRAGRLLPSRAFMELRRWVEQTVA